MARELNKKTLSKGILEMKFMKKTKEKIESEIENTYGHDTMYGNNITSEMRKAKTIYVLEPSIMACEDLREGRLSFGGVNPEIEKIMEVERRKKEGIPEQEADVSDVQLAQNYNENKQKLNTNKQQKDKGKNKRKFECDLPPRGNSIISNPFKRQKRGKQRK